MSESNQEVAKMGTKVMIVQEEAAKYAELIKEKFPEEVKNGRIEILTYQHQSEIKDDQIGDVEIIGTWPVLAPWMDKMPKLKWYMTFSSGYDHIIKANFLPDHVPLINVPGGSGVPIAEFVIGLMLNHTKGFIKLWEYQKERKFIRLQGGELCGKTLGIIGLGGIGREVAKRAKAFDMRVIGTETRQMEIPFVDEVYLAHQVKEIFEQSDYVVLCCPETPETIGMINKESLKWMKPTGYLINCARGSLIIKEDLMQALQEKWIDGAANDTFWIKDPVPSYLPPEDVFWDTPNLIITPHVSSWTNMYAARFGAVFVENIQRHLLGQELINVVKGNKQTFGRGVELHVDSGRNLYPERQTLSR
ncbi:MAG: D-2-hydroxyacid dehydrogenase [Clostridia bacterium]|nr:D-2-hydroxyacid dehydrogenase [Clostridia bacterium]